MINSSFSLKSLSNNKLYNVNNVHLISENGYFVYRCRYQILNWYFEVHDEDYEWDFNDHILLFENVVSQLAISFRNNHEVLVSLSGNNGSWTNTDDVENINDVNKRNNKVAKTNRHRTGGQRKKKNGVERDYSSIPCKDFKQHGMCRFGNKCRYKHEVANPIIDFEPIDPVDPPTSVGEAPCASDSSDSDNDSEDDKLLARKVVGNVNIPCKRTKRKRRSCFELLMRCINIMLVSYRSIRNFQFLSVSFAILAFGTLILSLFRVDPNVYLIYTFVNVINLILYFISRVMLRQVFPVQEDLDDYEDFLEFLDARELALYDINVESYYSLAGYISIYRGNVYVNLVKHLVKIKGTVIVTEANTRNMYYSAVAFFGKDDYDLDTLANSVMLAAAQCNVLHCRFNQNVVYSGHSFGRVTME
jgi:hypothetical protein